MNCLCERAICVHECVRMCNLGEHVIMRVRACMCVLFHHHVCVCVCMRVSTRFVRMRHLVVLECCLWKGGHLNKLGGKGGRPETLEQIGCVLINIITGTQAHQSG